MDPAAAFPLLRNVEDEFEFEYEYGDDLEEGELSARRNRCLQLGVIELRTTE